MEQKEFCFILRIISLQGHHYSVLTRLHGRIDLFVRPTRHFHVLRPGTLLTTFFKKRDKRVWLADNTNVMLYPTCQTAASFYFLHHLLELCYYFLPAHDASPQIFSLLYCMIKVMSRTGVSFDRHSFMIRKLCVFKFLILNGFYPQHDVSDVLAVFDELVAAFVDLSQEEKVECVAYEYDALSKQKMRQIDRWITQIIENHPSRHLFKTTRFVKESY